MAKGPGVSWAKCRLRRVKEVEDNPNMVNASRDAPVEIAAIEQRLAVVGGLMTCLRRCNVQSDCDNGWVCSDCAPDTLGDGSHYDVFTVNGQGYYTTKLQAHYNNKLSAV
ncbi:hypothetical protein T459_04348 [Capsicum annuum]|uniref:Uncharacterized protein n=1 Tax=Capsicum annuum TaxID=4072 RepID=A0A2G3A4S1_CAPAN|nr:hypothetical protein T459_04348 [Capsicum annuum]